MSKVRTASRATWPGILISATTSMTLVAGCWGGQPAPVTPGVPTAAPAQPEAPVQPTAPTSSNELKGRAMLNGQPLANATLKVYDALSGQPLANVIAAGGSNFGVTADSFKTDAEGNFSIGVSGFTSGNVAKVVADTGKGSLALVVAAPALTTAKQMHVLQAAGGAGAGAVGVAVASSSSNSTVFLMNEVSTAVAQVASGPLALASTLKPEAAAEALTNLFVKLANEVVPKISELFAKDPQSAAKLVSSVDAQGTSTDTTVVVDIFAKSGTQGALKALVNTLISTVAAIAKDPAKLNATTVAKTIDFIGTGLKATTSGPVMTIRDSNTGATTTITLSGSGSTTTTSGGSGGGGSSSSVSFNPTATFQTNANRIRLKVQQTAGQSDIESLVVRVPVQAAVNATTIQGLDPNDPAASLTSPGGLITIGLNSPVMSLMLAVAPATKGTLNFTGMPPYPFGGTQTFNYSGGIENEGTIQVSTLGNAVLGNVRVLTGDNSKRWWSADYIYVAAKYMDQPDFHNATSLITKNGHTSSLDFSLPAGISFTNSQALDIKVYVKPRISSASARTVTATYDSSTLSVAP